MSIAQKTGTERGLNNDLFFNFVQRREATSEGAYSRRLMWLTVFVVWGLITHGTYAGSGDEPHYLMIARSLIFDHDIDLANDYADPTNLVGAGHIAPGAHAIPGKDGALRPVHDVGLPIVFAPLVGGAYGLAEWLANAVPATILNRTRLNGWLLMRHILSLAMAVVTGWLAIEMFTLFRAIGGSTRTAFWWSALSALSPPLLSHSFLFFTEIPSALMTLLAFRQLRTTDVRPSRWFTVGLVVGLLVLFHVRNGPIAAALFMILVHSLWRRSALCAIGAMATGVFIILVARALVLFEFWGTWVTSPIAHPGTFDGLAASVTTIGVRLTGVFFDRETGLLPYAPVYLLSLPGLVALCRTSRRLGFSMLFVLSCYLLALALPIVNPHGITGGWCPAARFLVPVLPLLATACYSWAIRMTSQARYLLWPLVILQLALDVFVWQKPKTLWSDGNGHSELLASLGGVGAQLERIFPSWSATDASGMPFVVATLGWVLSAIWLSTSRWSLAGSLHGELSPPPVTEQRRER